MRPNSAAWGRRTTDDELAAISPELTPQVQEVLTIEAGVGPRAGVATRRAGLLSN